MPLLKYISEEPVVEGSLASTKLIFQKSWSFWAAVEAVFFFVGIVSVFAFTSILSNEAPSNDSPSLFGTGMGVVAFLMLVALTGLVYSCAKDYNFVSAVCRKYGYQMTELKSSIVEVSASGESRMLLPPSSKKPTVDVYVCRNSSGVFVEEVHHHDFKDDL